MVSTRTSYTLLLLYMIRVAYLASALDRARAMSGTIRFWDLPGAILGGAPMSWGPVDVYFGVYVRVAGIGMPATISQVIAVLSSLMAVGGPVLLGASLDKEGYALRGLMRVYLSPIDSCATFLA